MLSDESIKVLNKNKNKKPPTRCFETHLQNFSYELIKITTLAHFDWYQWYDENYTPLFCIKLHDLQLENKPKAVNIVELYNNKHAYLQYH